VAAFNFSCFERGKVFAVAFLQFEKAGYLVRDAESEYLDLIQDEEDAMGAIVGASITYDLSPGVSPASDFNGQIAKISIFNMCLDQLKGTAGNPQG